jgi:multiple RNA-binding domain-containing protein 1
VQAHIPLDHLTNQSKGMAYVTFAKPSCALAAYESLDKKSFQGRLLHILPALDRNGMPERADAEILKKSTFKNTRQIKKKTDAGRVFNWATMFMNVCNILSHFSFHLRNFI